MTYSFSMVKMESFLIVQGFLFWSFLAFSSGQEENHYLYIGSGVAHPSMVGLSGGNPAGLTYNARSKLLGDVGLSTLAGTKNPTYFGGGFFAGNGKIGGGVAMTETPANGGSTSSNSINAGLGFELGSLNTSVGILCAIASSSLSCSKLGLLYDSKRSFRLGGTVITGAYPVVTGGFAYDFNKNATFVTDVTENFSSKVTTIAPGIGFYFSNLQFMASYYITKITGTATSSTTFFGFGLELTKTFHLLAYSNLSSSHELQLVIAL